MSVRERSILEIVTKEGSKNVQEHSAQLGRIDGRYRWAAISKMREFFPDVHGPHSWVHRGIFISVVLQLRLILINAVEYHRQKSEERRIESDKAIPHVYREDPEDY